MVVQTESYVKVADLAKVQETGCLTVQANGHTLVLFAYGDAVYAVDNRCPHMGFPLDKGTVKDGILTCHWHHARFDLASGGTFDLFADDVPAFPADVQDGMVWVDLTPREDPRERQRVRLRIGLERNISLVIAKAVLVLTDGDGDPVEPFRVGLEFGATYRQAGWGQGLTILTLLMNMVPRLDPEDRPRALYHGLSALANEVDGNPPRFGVTPLPHVATDIATLKKWFRQFIEVRDDEGAERCIISALRAGATPAQMADMLFAAVTDHRYIQIGHPADFTNKAFAALDLAGWDYAETVLTSLARGYAMADRMEESNAWRNPIDLIALLGGAFEQIAGAVDAGRNRRGQRNDRVDLVNTLLDDDPQASVDALLDALRGGATEVELASSVSYAAALRIARFHTSNEFGDWDTALHTFTFSNAVEQGLRRAPSNELLRGVFDAAMSVYLDRFLNIPAARLPHANGKAPDTAIGELPELLNNQQQVNEAGQLVAQYLYGGGSPERIMAMLGKLLLREDRNFHTLQTVEAAFRQFDFCRAVTQRVQKGINARLRIIVQQRVNQIDTI